MTRQERIDVLRELLAEEETAQEEELEVQESQRRIYRVSRNSHLLNKILVLLQAIAPNGELVSLNTMRSHLMDRSGEHHGLSSTLDTAKRDGGWLHNPERGRWVLTQKFRDLARQKGRPLNAQDLEEANQLVA